MKNTITCKNCGAENPYYEKICNNCSSYLRDKIFNIDFWNIAYYLIETPQKAFTAIIHSEHKNMIIPIIIFAILRILFDTIFTSVYVVNNINPFRNFFANYFIELFVFGILWYLFALLLKSFDALLKIKTRIKDYFAVIVYSQIGLLISLFIILVIEIIVFGNNLFAIDPSPFFLKEFLAYTLLGFEIVFRLWMVFLFAYGLYVQTRNILFSIIVSIIFFFINYLIIFNLSTILY
ncbi:MAG TPA: hypothetical protein VFF33_02555 [Ignavibacteriaceae bacterium]|nr:hypothetical protein [Ignavibacteriaceae bacterium]